MACFHPVQAFKLAPGFYIPGVTSKGNLMEKTVVFNRPGKGVLYEEIIVPCGYCLGCRLKKSKEWALRCMHEASLYENNCFLTLTYKEEPLYGSLNVRDIQLFFKKLRKKFGSNIRFLQCGEYGELLQRPHHHVLLFNFRFPDEEYVTGYGKSTVYHSKILEEIWSHGFTSIGNLSFDSAAYVCGYVVKKIYGEMAEDHYQGRRPEYVTMSRRPGIGHEFYRRYYSDIYPKDYITFDGGVKARPARYYDKLFESHFPGAFEKLKEKRKNERIEYTPDELKRKEDYLHYCFSQREKERKYRV